jgi:hypothetical protein
MVAGNQVASQAPAQPGAVRRRPRSGSGGRWLIWPLRIFVWAVLLLVGYRGVAAIIAGPEPAALTTPRAAHPPVTGFPVTLAEAYALEFGHVYLNFSPAASGARAHALAAFLPPAADSQLGWNGAGSQALQAEQVASVTVRDAHHAVVTLLARVNGRLVELGVPIYASARGLVVTGEPALLAAPARVMPPPVQAGPADQGAASALGLQLPAFFQAYASGDQVTLSRFLAPGARVTGLAGAVRFAGITQITVPAGGATRRVTVAVTWQLPASGATPAQLQMVYALTVVRQDGSWNVLSIGAAPAQPGPP